MSLLQEEGRIIQNTIGGSYGKVRDLDRNDYILIDSQSCPADAPREYCVGDHNKRIKINQYTDTINALSVHEFN